MPRKHNRKLGFCAAALTTARIPSFDIEVMTQMQNDLEKILLDCAYLETAPFEWVTISLRYGLRNEDEPHYEPINEEYGDLPLAIELDTHELIGCTRQAMRDIFEVAALKALVHAGRKFGLPHGALEDRLHAKTK